MKIKVSEENNTAISKWDLDLIKDLEGDNLFEEMINNARKYCKIDKLQTSFKTAEIYSRSMHKSKEIVDFYNLPKSFISSLQFLIVTGEFMSSGQGIYLMGNWEDHDELQITITQKLAIEDIAKWMRETKVFRDRLKKLPRKPRGFNTDKELKKEVFELASKGLKPKQISEIFAKKYKDNTLKLKLTNESNISKIIYAYKKRLRLIASKSTLK